MARKSKYKREAPLIGLQDEAPEVVLLEEQQETRRVIMAYCDRDTKQWVLQYEDGSTVRVQSAVINNVEFDRQELAGTGCGTDYRGFAKGEHTAGEMAENVDMTNAKRILCNYGKFFDRYKCYNTVELGRLDKCSKLIMLKDFSSRYIQ